MAPPTEARRSDRRTGLHGFSARNIGHGSVHEGNRRRHRMHGVLAWTLAAALLSTGTAAHAQAADPPPAVKERCPEGDTETDCRDSFGATGFFGLAVDSFAA